MQKDSYKNYKFLEHEVDLKKSIPSESPVPKEEISKPMPVLNRPGVIMVQDQWYRP